jgi:hypothetical protein
LRKINCCFAARRPHLAGLRLLSGQLRGVSGSRAATAQPALVQRNIEGE